MGAARQAARRPRINTCNQKRVLCNTPLLLSHWSMAWLGCSARARDRDTGMHVLIARVFLNVSWLGPPVQLPWGKGGGILQPCHAFALSPASLRRKVYPQLACMSHFGFLDDL